MLQIQLSGNITANATTKEVKGAKVIQFNVADNKRYTSKDGERIEETRYIRCSIWNKDEKTAAILTKGRPIALVGTLTADVYNEKPVLNVRVNNFQIMGKGNNSKPAATGSSHYDNEPAENVDHFDPNFHGDDTEAVIDL